MKKIFYLFCFSLFLFSSSVYSQVTISNFGNNSSGFYTGQKGISPCNGEEITIIGTNFDDGIASPIVTSGASMSIWEVLSFTSTIIVAKIPELPTGSSYIYSGIVQVSNLNGNASSSPNVIEVEPCPDNIVVPVPIQSKITLSGIDLSSISSLYVHNIDISASTSSIPFNILSNNDIEFVIPNESTLVGTNNVLEVDVLGTVVNFTGGFVTSAFEITPTPTFNSITPNAATYQSNEAGSLTFSSDFSFAPENKYIVEFSSDGFTFQQIGELSSTNATNIGFTLPSNLVDGSYQLRLKSTNPQTISSNVPITVSNSLPQTLSLIFTPNISYNVGETLTIGYSVSGANFNSNNELFVYMSDGEGDFGNGFLIGQSSGFVVSGSGSINCTLPNSVPAPGSSGFRIRIESSNPSGVISNESDPFSVFDPVPTVTGIIPLNGRPGDVITISGGLLDLVQSVEFSSGIFVYDFQVNNNGSALVVTLPGYGFGLIVASSLGVNLHTQRSSINTSPLNFTFSAPPVPQITSINPTSAYPLEKVTLTGSNLADITSLNISNKSLSNYNILNDNTIIYTVDELNSATDTVSGKFTASVYDLVNGTSTGTFAILAPPFPTITGFSPTSGLPGTRITINGQNLEHVIYVDLVNNSGLYRDFIFQSTDKIIFETAVSPVTSTSPIILRSTYSGDIGDTSSQNYTIIAFPPPTINGIGTISQLEDNFITITGKGLNLINVYALINATESLDDTHLTKYEDSDTLVKLLIPYNGLNKTYSAQIYATNATVDYYDQTISGILNVLSLTGKVENMAIANGSNFISSDIIQFVLTLSGEFGVTNLFSLQMSDKNTGSFLGKRPVLGVGSSEVNVVTIPSFYLYTLEELLDTTSRGNYAVRVISNRAPPVVYSPIVTFNYTPTPVITSFNPFYGDSGDTVSVYVENLDTKTITGVKFNGNSAFFEILPPEGEGFDDYIRAIVPNGDVTGLVSLQYDGGETFSFYNFIQSSDPICDKLEGITLLGNNLIRSSGESVDLLFEMNDNFIETNVLAELQFSDVNGFFNTPFTIENKLIDTLKTGIIFSISGIVSNSLIASPAYSLRLKISNANGGCVSAPIRNITINGFNPPLPTTICSNISSVATDKSIYDRGDSFKLVFELAAQGTANFNAYYAQGSNEQGSFDNLIIGEGAVGNTIFTDLPGVFTIVGVIDSTVAFSDLYRLRIVNTTTGCVSSVTSANVSVRARDIVTVPSTLAFRLVADTDTISEMGDTLRIEAVFTDSTLSAEQKRVRWSVAPAPLAQIDTTGLLTAKLNGVVTVTATSVINPTVTGTLSIVLINQYVPVTGLKLFYALNPDGEEDTADTLARTLSYAVPDVVAVMLFEPDSATNVNFKLEILQSSNIARVGVDIAGDSSSYVISLNREVSSSETITIVGTSMDNPTVTGVFTLRALSELEKVDRAPAARPVSTTVPGASPLNPCEATYELFIDSVYTNYQWFYVSSGGDTAKVVGAGTHKFKPVIEGNYFVYAEDSTKNYVYLAYNLTAGGSTFRPTVSLSGVNDGGIDDDTLLIASPAPSYQWYINGRLIKGETRQTLRVYYNGEYYVSVNDEKNCKAVSDIFTVSKDYLSEFGRSDFYGNDSTVENYGRSRSNIRLFPNPAESEFTLLYQSLSARTLHIKLFNSMGTEVQYTSVAYRKNQLRTAKIDISNLPSGLYTVQILDGEELQYSKVFVR